MFKKAVPIWSHKVCENQYVVFKQNFDWISESGGHLKIRSSGEYTCYLNGILISFGQYPDYEHYCVVNQVDIPRDLFMTSGNMLRILAYNPYSDSSTHQKKEPMLIFEISSIEDAQAFSGNNTFFSDETGYTSGQVPMITTQIGFSFVYDSKIEPNSFQPVKVVKAEELTYHERPIKLLQLDEQVPSSIYKSGKILKYNASQFSSQRMYMAEFADDADNSVVGEANTFLILDMKKETVGFLTFDIIVEKDCDIDIGYGEHLDDGRVRTFVGGRNFAFTYKAKAGRNQFTHYFTRIAARYIQLCVYDSIYTLNYMSVTPVRYPLETVNMPEELSAKEQSIYQVCISTLQACMHDHYEDCPWREQALYAMDARNQMLVGYYTFGEFEFAKASLRMLALGLRDDGLLELCAPARVCVNIPVFSLMWIVALQEYVSHSYDYDFAKEMLHIATKILDAYEVHCEDGLYDIWSGEEYWNFYEWNPGLSGIDYKHKRDSALQLFAAYALKNIQELCLTLGCVEQAEGYGKKYAYLKQRINEVYWTGEGYRYIEKEESQPELVQALAVASRVCNSQQQAIIIERLCQNSYLPNISLSHRILKYDAILQEKHRLPSVKENILDIWGRMIDCGATTFWETEQGADDFEKAGSLCHGWSATPAYIYHKYGEKGLL